MQSLTTSMGIMQMVAVKRKEMSAVSSIQPLPTLVSDNDKYSVCIVGNFIFSIILCSGKWSD